MDSNQNMCSQSNLKREAVTSRTCQLLRLLYGTTCFEVMLNRRMPNGTYGGVRGEKKNLPYSILLHPLEKSGKLGYNHVGEKGRLL